jgi:hypothetical protein
MYLDRHFAITIDFLTKPAYVDCIGVIPLLVRWRLPIPRQCLHGAPSEFALIHSPGTQPHYPHRTLVLTAQINSLISSKRAPERHPSLQETTIARVSCRWSTSPSQIPTGLTMAIWARAILVTEIHVLPKLAFPRCQIMTMRGIGPQAPSTTQTHNTRRSPGGLQM